MRYRIRNFFVIFALLLVSYLLQYSVFIRIPVINCAPNLMLLVTFAFAYIRNKNAGMLVGFFAGLFIDVFYCDVIGYNALIFLLVGFVCGSLRKVYYSDSLFTQLFIFTICEISCCLLYFFFWHILQSKFDFAYSFTHVMLPEIIFTLFAGILLIRPLAWLVNKLYFYRNEAENA